MNSYPRQAKEIESLASQLSAANNRIRVLDGALERQRTELMALREKALLLEQRPTREAHEAVKQSRDSWKEHAGHLETGLKVTHQTVTYLRSLNADARHGHELQVAKDVIAHKNRQINRLSSDLALAQKLLREEQRPVTKWFGIPVQSGLDAQMQEAQAMLEPPCDCPMCQARGHFDKN